MKDNIQEAIYNSLKRLVMEDGYLFDCPVEQDAPYRSRKLHEVCLNHRLANHLQSQILPILTIAEPMFVDIEFNRQGGNFKKLEIEGRDKTVRPDIIIHNRKAGDSKLNLLVAECKKDDADAWDIDYDVKKIHAFMNDEEYEYSFGLQVIYGRNGVRAEFFFKTGRDIESETVAVPRRVRLNGEA